jgi:hypothetical protein
MRKHLLAGAVLVGSFVVAQVHGGIFNRGGGCANGQCGGGYSGGYYATNVVKSPSDYAVRTFPAPAQAVVAAPRVAQPVVVNEPATQPTVSTQTAPTRASNVSTATRPRLFRRWGR